MKRTRILWLLPLLITALVISCPGDNGEQGNPADNGGLTNPGDNGGEETNPAQPKQITVYMAGDSTMCVWQEDDPNAQGWTGEGSAYANYQIKPRGWGMYLQNYFDEDEVKVINVAHSGRSAKDFLALAGGDNYSRIVNNIKAGDYLFVSFGHNDEKDQSLAGNIGTATEETEGSYQWYLYEKYVKVAREKGATPVLLTPVSRRANTGGENVNSHGLFPAAVKALAASKNVAIIDLTQLSADFLNNLNASGGAAATLAMMSRNGSGGADNSHFSEKGAKEICELVVKDIKRQNIMQGVNFKTGNE